MSKEKIPYDCVDDNASRHQQSTMLFNPNYTRKKKRFLLARLTHGSSDINSMLDSDD